MNAIREEAEKVRQKIEEIFGVKKGGDEDEE